MARIVLIRVTLIFFFIAFSIYLISETKYIGLLLNGFGSPMVSLGNYQEHLKDTSIRNDHIIWRQQKVKDIAVAVVTNGKRQNITIPAIFDTWGQDFERIEVFSATAGDLISRVVPTDPNKARSSWEEMNALKILYDLYPLSPWYYKVDDDTYVNAAHLSEVAHRNNPLQDGYIGKRLGIKLTNRSTGSTYYEAYCAGGCGYLISNSLMKKIVHRLLAPVEEWNSCCSDVQVGTLVNAANHSASCKNDIAFYGQSVFPLPPSSRGDMAFHRGVPYTMDGSAGIHRLFHTAAIHYTPPALQYIFRIMFLGFGYESRHENFRVGPENLTAMPSFFLSHENSQITAVSSIPSLPTAKLEFEDQLKMSLNETQCCPCISSARDSVFGRSISLKRGSLAAKDFNSSGVCGENGFKCVISFTLFGASRRYNVGAIRNAMLIKHVFPGWIARFYCEESSVPSEVMQDLKVLGSEIIAMGKENKSDLAGTLFSRFMIAEDTSVDRFLVRDTDSRLNVREKAAVNEWMESGFSVHTMRDHPAHARPMNGGMWGAVRGAIPNISALAAMVPKHNYSDDQNFLGKYIFPLVEHDQLGHDSVSCWVFPNSRPFPTRRIGYEHVGAVVSVESEEAREVDTNALSSFTANPACRKHIDWVKG